MTSRNGLPTIRPILGDDLLIVGKEFSGFDRTDERLDLLAVDTDGKIGNHRTKARRFRNRCTLAGHQIRQLFPTGHD